MRLQKPLGWVQRYLYNIEQGPIPGPSAVLSVDQDWPLPLYAVRQISGATIAGQVTTTVYQPDVEHHGLVIGAHLESAGAAFPATDIVTVTLADEVVRVGILGRFQPTVAFSFLPLIGGEYLSGADRFRGPNPIYVPPRWQVEVRHASVAGGINFNVNLIVLERLRSYPLRVP